MLFECAEIYGKSEMNICDIQPKHFHEVIAVNLREVDKTSPMNIDHLGDLIGFSAFSKVVVSNKKVAGFVIAIASGSEYENENYAWFSSNYLSFLYIDRVVIAEGFKGKGVGSMLYKDVFNFARDEKLDHVVCEYNLDPVNQASQAFHSRWGFHEVGVQTVLSGSKRVSLQAARASLITT